MPELPEVETIRRVLDKKLAARKILQVDIRARQLTAGRLARDLRAQSKGLVRDLQGQKILAVRRRAKYLIWDLERGLLVIHLGMTGQMFAGCDGQGPKCPGMELPDKHTHVIFRLSGRWQVYFRDIRKFGRIRFLPPGQEEQFFQHLGPEPLSAAFTPEILQAGLQEKKASIKALLLNQKVVAGLGNIYVDEVLFRAGIAPQRLAGKVRGPEIKQLHSAIQSVLKEAIHFRGTSMSDYYDPESRKGGFQARLQVYGHAGEKCPKCEGIIRKGVVAQRGTHWCGHCQR